MTLIKIDEDRYVNSDHIVAILPNANRNTPPTMVIYTSTSLQIVTTVPVIHYLTQQLDADDAAVFEQPQALSVSSRLAIHLRNQTAAQTFSELAEFLPNDNNALVKALSELLNQNVIRATIQSDGQPAYYHASNAGREIINDFPDSAGW